tara:strand:- start:5774 stop:5953 length:180 start_codon:yes stop_codon:yes gene_type:complete
MKEYEVQVKQTRTQTYIVKAMSKRSGINKVIANPNGHVDIELIKDKRVDRDFINVKEVK